MKRAPYRLGVCKWCERPGCTGPRPTGMPLAPGWIFPEACYEAMVLLRRKKTGGGPSRLRENDFSEEEEPESDPGGPIPDEDGEDGPDA